jgi:hypothetical protein
MQADLSNLQNNLIEIYAALHDQPRKDHLKLYATNDGSVFYQGTCMAKVLKEADKFWQWIQWSHNTTTLETSLKKILNDSFNKSVRYAYLCRQERIWHNLRQIDEIWKLSLGPQDFANQRTRYANLLSQELEGSVEEGKRPDYLTQFDQRAEAPLSAQKIKEHRLAIMNFHQATYFFWSIFIQDEELPDNEKNAEKNEALRAPLTQYIQFSTLTDYMLFKALKNEGKWVQLEGVMQLPIPVTLFAKLGDPQGLTVNENKRLNQWVEALNNCQKAISSMLFSSVLTEVMSVIKLQGSSSLTLPDLVDSLEKRGCLHIHQEDGAHVDWRDKLKKGDAIDCNGVHLILGELLSLSSDDTSTDTFKIFAIQNYPDYVVKIAHNRFLLLLEDKRASNEKDHWGVRLVETVTDLKDFENGTVVSGIDSMGRCTVLERLKSTFASYDWTSDGFKLTQEDEKPALVFANHIFCMSQWKATPLNLSLEHLMWDEKGVLKTTRLLKKGPSNYNDLEELCEKAVKGNFYVLWFLVKVSKLSEHPMAIYYRNAVENTLRTGEIDTIGRPLPLAHRQDIYTERVKELCQEAQQLRERCFSKVRAALRKKGQYSYLQEEQLKSEIADKLLEFYRALPTPGILSPTLESQTVASFSKNAEKDSLLDPSVAKKYYQEKHKWIMDRNKAAALEEGSL